MDQFAQLKNNLRQTRDKLNNVLGQVNQDLQNSEQIVWNISHQLNNQSIGSTTTGVYNPQFSSTNMGSANYGSTNYGSSNFVQNQPFHTTGYNQYGGAGAGSMITRSQYNPGQYSGAQSGMGGFTGTSQFGANNNYYQSSAQKGGGVNQYGAKYSSANRDEDVGNAFYQSAGMTSAGMGGTTSGGYGARSQYNPEQIYGAQSGTGGLSNTSQYGASNNYYQSSVQKGGGANQYGAQYSSGTRDEDVGSAYYQSKQGF